MSKQSIDAWIDQQPHIPPTEQKILKLLDQHYSLPAQAVSYYLKIANSSAFARLSEMYDKGMVVQMKNGKYRITEQHEVDKCIQERLEARYQKWRKLGEKYGWHFRYECLDKHGEPKPEDYE